MKYTQLLIGIVIGAIVTWVALHFSRRQENFSLTAPNPNETTASLQAKQYQVMYDLITDTDGLVDLQSLNNYLVTMGNTVMEPTLQLKRILQKFKAKLAAIAPPSDINPPTPQSFSTVLSCWQTNFPSLVFSQPSSDNPPSTPPNLTTLKAIKFQILYDLSNTVQLSDLNTYLTTTATTVSPNMNNPYYIKNFDDLIPLVGGLEQSCGDLSYLF